MLMKTLIIVRHAKSSWANPGQEDIERPLNERGKTDAPDMAGRLFKKKIQIDTFISSPAKRARRTAAFFIEAYDGKEKDLVIDERLYPGSVSMFYEVVGDIKKRHSAAAIFSHNPGITDFVNTLTEHKIDNMPTCSVFIVTADVEKWADFGEAKKQLLLFDYPKNGKHTG